MPKCDLNKVSKQLYWNHTSAWEFSRKFAAPEHLILRTPLALITQLILVYVTNVLFGLLTFFCAGKLSGEILAQSEL